jgi:hypothetical protein
MFARIGPEMNAKLFPLGAVLLALLTGCATTRYATAPVFPDSTPMPLPESKGPPTADELLARAGAHPLVPFAGEGWRDLFDGKSLAGWRVTEFDEGGSVVVTNGLLVLQRGQPFVGVNGTNEIPTVNYELAFDAMRVAGDDFFCGLTFPVREAHCSLIVGGWGGGIVGLSNLDGADASENETTQYISFERGRWYRVRLRVSEQKIEAWIEQKKVVNLITTGRKLEVRFGEIMMSRPFGLAAWDTSAAFRAIKIRPVSGPAEESRY